MRTFLTLLVFCSVCISAGHAQDINYSFKENYTVSVPAKLFVSSYDGNLEVIPSGGNEIEVFYIVRKENKVLKIGRGELEKELILDVVSDRNSLSITVKHKDITNWFKDRMNVNFRILVPRETMCDLNTSDGNISVEGLASDQQCKTSDGNIYMSRITGKINGVTSDGNIHLNAIKGAVAMKTSDGNIRLDDITGDVQTGTGDGNIELERVTGNISLKTSDGDIAFNEVSGSVKAVTSDGNIRGRIVELKNELTVRTSDGNIHVSIPGNLGLDLDISGESLDVPLSNFTGKSDKKFIQGKSNGGGIAVNMATSDGNVTLSYL